MLRLLLTIGLTCAASGAMAELRFEAGTNSYGTPGIVDMPTATAFTDADLVFSVSGFGDQTRTSLAFQMTKRLTLSFRYSTIDNFRGTGITRYDRSFMAHYLLLREGRITPSFAVGLNDFLGTGIFSGEYVVASKTIGPRVRVTGGLGWGRLASSNGFTNPLGILSEEFEERGRRSGDFGGQFELENLFQGDAAFFGGIEVQATEKLSFALEYSSDAYVDEDGPTFDRESPWNARIGYKIRDGIDLGVFYAYGSEIGAQLTFTINPTEPPFAAGNDGPPLPVVDRETSLAARDSWAGAGGRERGLETLRTGLAAEGIRLHGFSLRGDTARVEIENNRYNATSQAIGRTARILTATMPVSVETFVIVPIQRSMAASAVTIRRRDMEELAFSLDNSWSSYARAEFDDAQRIAPLDTVYPQFSTGITPYFSPSLFDPDDPLRYDVGIQFRASYEPVAGLLMRGVVRQKLFGNLDESDRPSDSVLPRVRSESNLYQKTSTKLTELTAAYFFKPADTLYGRLTLGYLEPQFGGVSAEVLWKPTASRLALGLEANYVKQRGFDQDFSFRDYEVATGHASAYYALGNGFEAQVDAGRYLAGDWGATLGVDRTFANGWRVGAFATLTDVSFDDFGEGSFDKGIRIVAPFDWLTGRPSSREIGYVVRPILRDGGARVNVTNRLYYVVRDEHKPDLKRSWGRFWK